MYIVAIAWAYISILMAATEPNLVAGLMTLVFYGILPLALLLWIFGTPKRRYLQRQREQANDATAASPTEPTDKENLP